MALCDKKSWASERSARRKLAEIRAKRDRCRKARRFEVRAYQCPICRQWHLTSDVADYVLPSSRRRLRDVEIVD